MMMASALLAAFVCGVALSAPMGPVAMLCVRHGFAGRPWLGLATGLGCATCDLGTCWIVASSVDAASMISERLLHGLEGASGVLLVVLSLAGIFSKRKPSQQGTSEGVTVLGSGRLLRAWVEGLAITLANPLNAGSVSVFAASLMAINRGVRVEITALGLTAGILCWWVSLAWSCWKLRGTVGEHLLRFLDLAISAGLGIVGLLVLVRAFL